MNKIILDSIAIKDHEVELRDETAKFWGEYNKLSNINTKMYYELYKTGELAKITDYYVAHILDGWTVIDFIISTDNLSEEFINRMNENFPGNSFGELDQLGTCSVTGTKGMAFMVYPTYRDNCGVVSSRTEHPFIMRFSNKLCNELETKTSFDAAKAIIELCWQNEA